ncbi:HlyD family secretion protein [Aerophototrophica crusticola]|uniref:HlyD family secretion protein n=1 Tax=Aerophototrophica crusticola TaxID=1709002 RepID=A0A858RAY1_9PROT|nr:HlyD family secretion protein [Rhodospirillaceae bacterium B3]
MKKRIGLLLVPVLLAGAAWGGWHWWTVARFVESTDNAYVQADITTISPRVEGYVAAVPVVDNQPIRAGDVLASIDDRDFRARVDQARARIAAQEAAIANIDSRLSLEQALINRAEADVASAQADLNRAEADRKRYAALAGRDFASQQTLSNTVADAEKAQAALRRAQAALVAERDQVAVLETEKARARATLAELKAALSLAENDLEKTVIRAPVDGVVGNQAARVGQYVRPGTQLMAVVPVQAAYVTANFKETQIEGLRVGQKVTVAVDAFPDLKAEGRIESLSPASGAQFSLLPPENATGNFTKIVQRVPVRVSLPQDGPLAGLLRPGLSVVVEVDTRDKADQPKPQVAAR